MTERLLDQADALMDRLGHLKAQTRGFTPTSARMERLYAMAERRFYRRLKAGGT